MALLVSRTGFDAAAAADDMRDTQLASSLREYQRLRGTADGLQLPISTRREEVVARVKELVGDDVVSHLPYRAHRLDAKRTRKESVLRATSPLLKYAPQKLQSALLFIFQHPQYFTSRIHVSDCLNEMKSEDLSNEIVDYIWYVLGELISHTIVEEGEISALLPQAIRLQVASLIFPQPIDRSEGGQMVQLFDANNQEVDSQHPIIYGELDSEVYFRLATLPHMLAQLRLERETVPIA